MRIERLQQAFNLPVRWTVFPLHPEIPNEGMSLHALFAGRFDVDAALQRLQQVAAEVGLPLGNRSMTYNSRRAQELGKWAEEIGRGEAFRAAVFAAYFVDGRNIGSPAVLREIVTAIDLDPDAAEQALTGGRYAAAVDADWERAATLGVTAVPTCLYKGEALVGFQAEEAFIRLVGDRRR